MRLQEMSKVEMTAIALLTTQMTLLATLWTLLGRRWHSHGLIDDRLSFFLELRRYGCVKAMNFALRVDSALRIRLLPTDRANTPELARLRDRLLFAHCLLLRPCTCATAQELG